MSLSVPVKGLVFDLGDVLFQWSPNTKTTISAGVLRKILSSPTWFEYECGRLTRDECYDESAKDLFLDPLQIAEAFRQARESLQSDEAIVSFLRDLRQRSSVKIYAMSNVAQEDFAALAERMDWSLFDQVFISGVAGMRKPDPEFFRHVLQNIDLSAEEVVFVDDKQENVSAAEALGIRGIVFGDSTVQVLRALFDNPIERGYKFLSGNARKFDSITDSGVPIADNFAQLLILEATQNRNLVSLVEQFDTTWNFFAGQATLVPGGVFPDDLDTTSLALTVLPNQRPTVISSLLDKMLECVDLDGTFMTYFDREKPRKDAVVSANVLTCFYRHGRGHELPHTLQYLNDVLLHRSYLLGTRYYPSPDCCLGFFGRLLPFLGNDIPGHTQFRTLLKSRVQERVGKGGDGLELAVRILACGSMDIECSGDWQALLAQQCEDGGWEAGWMYRYGSSGVRIGNRGVTTALAVKALSFSFTSDHAATRSHDRHNTPGGKMRSVL